MFSSPRNRIEAARDIAEWGAAVMGGGLCLVIMGGLAWHGAFCTRDNAVGEMEIYPDLNLTMAPAPMPALEAPPPEPVREPGVEPELEPIAAPVPEPEAERMTEPEPEPVMEPERPQVEAPAPSEAVQPEAEEEEGDSGQEDAIRTEWMTELRRRIEKSKYYPGMARYARETGTVRLRVEIGPAGEIGVVRVLDNSGSARLEQGALEILQRAGETPLGSQLLGTGFCVDVPVTYRLDPW